MASVTNDNNTRIPLSLLPRRLREDYAGDPPLTHQQLYKGVLDGRYPAERLNGRWFIRDRSLRLIAEAYGLTPKVKVA
jgi:hypothetical protein